MASGPDCDWCGEDQEDMDVHKVGDDFICEDCLWRLEEAAPAMYSALAICVNELIDLYERQYPNDESDNDATRAIDMAMSAMRKAKGDEQ